MRKKCKSCRKSLSLLAEKMRGTCNFCAMLAAPSLNQGTLSEGWPRKSLALAVHPSQIEEFRREARELGTHAEFDADGQMIVDSAAHQAEYCKAYNMLDADYSRRGFA